MKLSRVLLKRRIQNRRLGGDHGVDALFWPWHNPVSINHSMITDYVATVPAREAESIHLGRKRNCLRMPLVATVRGMEKRVRPSDEPPHLRVREPDSCSGLQYDTGH